MPCELTRKSNAFNLIVQKHFWQIIPTFSLKQNGTVFYYGNNSGCYKKHIKKMLIMQQIQKNIKFVKKFLHKNEIAMFT